jgi:hypothetical protein
LENIDGKRAFCMNPAYAGRGDRGFYIPAICAFGRLNRFAVRDAQHPREGVRDYALVVWGTAAPSAAEVVSHFGREAARAAVFKVGPVLARRLGQPPFSFFVVELPLRAACVPIRVREQRSGETRRVGPKPTVCRRARSQRSSWSVASIRRMLQAEGATRRQAQEIVRLLSLRLSAQQMHVWLSHPGKSRPVPDPNAGKGQRSLSGRHSSSSTRHDATRVGNRRLLDRRRHAPFLHHDGLDSAGRPDGILPSPRPAAKPLEAPARARTRVSIGVLLST